MNLAVKFNLLKDTIMIMTTTIMIVIMLITSVIRIVDNNFISSVCLIVLHFFFVLSKAPEATLCGFAAAVCTPAPGGDFL
jgi:hypothetical protein